MTRRCRGSNGSSKLKVFDSRWDLVSEVHVSDDIPATSIWRGAGRPHLALTDNTLYVAYDTHTASRIEIVVKEYEIFR